MTRTVVRTVNIPETFAGTYEERLRNIGTHVWSRISVDAKCCVCDAKLWHAAARYPCGASVPRIVRTIYSDGTYRDVLVGHEEVEL